MANVWRIHYVHGHLINERNGWSCDRRVRRKSDRINTQLDAMVFFRISAPGLGQKQPPKNPPNTHKSMNGHAICDHMATTAWNVTALWHRAQLVACDMNIHFISSKTH
jgi:hypothetical protein